jgi:hypothetical protein
MIFSETGKYEELIFVFQHRWAKEKPSLWTQLLKTLIFCANYSFKIPILPFNKLR